MPTVPYLTRALSSSPVKGGEWISSICYEAADEKGLQMGTGTSRKIPQSISTLQPPHCGAVMPPIWGKGGDRQCWGPLSQGAR